MLVRRGKYWHLRIQFDNTLYQKSLHTSNKIKAQKLESAFRWSLLQGEYGIIDGAQAPTLKEFEARLLPHLKENCAPRTYGFYRENLQALNNFEALAKSKLSKIDPSLIEKFIQWRLKPDGKARAAITVNHSLRTLRRCLILARDWNLIKTVPRIKMLPNENQRDYVINETELTAMVEYLQSLYPESLMQFMLPFLVDTGLRITEACNLRWEHCDLNSKPAFIKIVKGKSKFARREIPLTERALHCLKESTKKSRCAYIFTGKGGRKPLTRHYPSEQFRAIRDSLGLSPDCVLHSTRHTFCTRLGMAGADAFTIQKLAGHSSITISQRYVHADRVTKQAAIALLDRLNNPPAIESSGVIEEI